MGVHHERMGRKGSGSLLSMRNLSLATLTVQFSTFILLLHYSRVMPTPDGHRYLPSTAVFLVEALKGAICFLISFYELSISLPSSTTLGGLLTAYGNAVFSGDSWKMAIPAGLYTFANTLQYVGISNLDAATFHVVYQVKIIVTALFSVIMLRKSLSGKQWLSLLLLMVGVAIVSMPNDEVHLAHSHHLRAYLPRSLSPLKEHFGIAEPGRTLRKRSATYAGIEEDEMALNSAAMDASLGVIAVVTVCTCSGFAGVYFEKVIKESPKMTSMWIRNLQISLYSLFPAFFIGIIFLDGEDVAKYGFFAGYNSIVTVSIVVQSLGGIVAAYCIFYADNISKNFAISISMVLSSLASFVFFDFTATTNFLVGTSIVLFSTWLYSSNESVAARTPPINIISSMDEKSPVFSPTEAGDMSIQIPKTPLADETALATSRPGSPSRKKRKNDLGYFSKASD